MIRSVFSAGSEQVKILHFQTSSPARYFLSTGCWRKYVKRSRDFRVISFENISLDRIKTGFIWLKFSLYPDRDLRKSRTVVSEIVFLLSPLMSKILPKILYIRYLIRKNLVQERFKDIKLYNLCGLLKVFRTLRIGDWSWPIRAGRGVRGQSERLPSYLICMAHWWVLKDSVFWNVTETLKFSLIFSLCDDLQQ